MRHEDKRENQFATEGVPKKRLRIWIGAISVAILFVAGGYFWLIPKPTQKPAEFPGQSVIIGVSRSFLSIPVYIAQKQGYFKEEDLDITIKEYNSGKQATEGLFAREVNISTVADMPVVFNSFKRRDFCLIATFAHSYHMVKIIARKDKGIKKGTDLRGKKVGANRGTSSHFFLGVFLIHNRLSISDVEMIHIRTVDMPAALKNNEVDAISAWQPYAQKAKQLLQDDIIELPSPEIYRTTFNFAVMKRFARECQETIKRFLRALDKASAFIRDNREESQEIIAANFKIDKEAVRTLWDDFVFKIFLDQSLLIEWEDIARWAIKNNLTDKTKIPNYLDFICLNGLEAVKPGAITIIR